MKNKILNSGLIFFLVLLLVFNLGKCYAQTQFPLQGTFCTDSNNYIISCYTFSGNQFIDSYISDTYCNKTSGTFSYFKISDSIYKINFSVIKSKDKNFKLKVFEKEFYMINDDQFILIKADPNYLNKYNRSKYLNKLPFWKTQ